MTRPCGNTIPADQGGDAYLVNGNMISILTALQQKAEDTVMQSQADGKERVQK